MQDLQTLSRSTFLDGCLFVPLGDQDSAFRLHFLKRQNPSDFDKLVLEYRPSGGEDGRVIDFFEVVDVHDAGFQSDVFRGAFSISHFFAYNRFVLVSAPPFN